MYTVLHEMRPKHTVILRCYDVLTKWPCASFLQSTSDYRRLDGTFGRSDNFGPWENLRCSSYQSCTARHRGGGVKTRPHVSQPGTHWTDSGPIIWHCGVACSKSNRTSNSSDEVGRSDYGPRFDRRPTRSNCCRE